MAEQPQLRHCYYDAQKQVWSVEGFWHHPQHRDYHKDWDGDYVILQAYGNFKNELKFVLLAEFPETYTLAWEPLKVCRFCGFSRMAPCKTRQPCPNLTDYRLEPDDAREDE